MLEPLVLPLPIRAMNAVGRALGALGLRLPCLEPDRLIATARRRTGLTALGADEASLREGLERLCRSADEEPELTLFGRMLTREHVLRNLANRLRLEDLRQRSPALLSAPLGAPLVVLGLPRSGTTHLHRLLSALPGARALATWELGFPIPAPGPDKRREALARDIARIRRFAPELDRKHHLDADEPEEDMILQDPSFISLNFFAQLPLFSYREWYEDADAGPAYRCWRDLLAVLRATTPDRRLVLKAPVHTAHVGTLLNVAPDALLVQTHRDPAVVLGSGCSLIYTLHGLSSRRVDPIRLGRAMTGFIDRVLRKSVAQRDKLPPGVVLDVTYQELLRDPVGVVERIHRHHGLPWDAQVRGAIERKVAERPKDRFGKHEYDLADFGLRADELAERFGWYRERFLPEG